MDKVDVLVNNAGFEYITPITDPSKSTDECFGGSLNKRHRTFSVTRRLLDKIPDGGRIVNTASMWGKTAVAEFSAYCASKHAVIGLTRSLSQELASRRISVNAVCPGWFAQLLRCDPFVHGRKRATPEADMLDEIVATQALDGLMEPQDMVDMYLFLAGPAADNITDNPLLLIVES